MHVSDSTFMHPGRTAAMVIVGWTVAAGCLIGAISGGLISEYDAYTVGLGALYSGVVLSLSLLAGWGGMWSLAHPALLGIGAYTAAYGSTHDWSLERTALTAAVLAGTTGGVLGFVGARFSHLYVALLTLVFGMVALEIFNRTPKLTGGDAGALVDELDSAFGFGALAPGSPAIVTAAIVLLLILIIGAVLFSRTPMRMRMMAAKTHPMVARTLGISPEAQSAAAFAISGAVVGLVGVVFALLSGFVGLESFSLAVALQLVVAAVLGGSGSIGGAVLGGAFIASMPMLSSATTLSQPVLQGVILVLVLVFLPVGLVPAVVRLFRRRPVTTALVATDVPSPIDASEPSETDRDGRAESREVVLSVEDLAVRFGGVSALGGVSIDARSGEVLGILGPNGAGKTTLLNAISGLLPASATHGHIAWRGRNLLRSRAAHRRGIGIARTFQHAELFEELSILENIQCTSRALLPRPSRALTLLADVGLEHVADQRPGEIPFGLQKRADLARAVGSGADLLLLDEPFGGLDKNERAMTARAVRRARSAGTAVVVIDHVLDELFAVADRAAAFDFGRNLATGRPEDVMAVEAVRAAYLGTRRLETGIDVPSGPASTRTLDGREAAVSVQGVGHHYGGVVALRGIDLEVPRGVVLGIVGANGSGKSTLGRVLHGSLVPTSGAVDRQSGDVVSIVPEGRGLFRSLSLAENLDVALFAEGLSGRAARGRREEVMHWLPERLHPRMQNRAGTLSGGEQQMLAMARALIARPAVVILDEPALGLAPGLVDEIYGGIQDLAERGITVIVLEQLLTRALDSCDSVSILRDGVLVATGNRSMPEFAEVAEAAYFGQLAATSNPAS